MTTPSEVANLIASACREYGLETADADGSPLVMVWVSGQAFVAKVVPA